MQCFARRAKAMLPLGAALGVLTVPTLALADCATLDGEVRAAMAAGEIGRYDELRRSVLAEPTCDSDYRARLGRVLALSALKSLAANTKSAAREPTVEELESLRRLAEPWQLMVSLGDAYYDARDWAKAFKAYEAALDDMRDEKANPSAPPASLERHAYQRAVQARALAPTFIASRSVRGAPSGLASPRFRNFTAVAVPVPVRFAYNSSALTPEGEAAAREILDYLKSQDARSVRLIGHTDPVGSEPFNLELSAARAEAVKTFLAQNGYDGAIEIVPRGEAELFQPDDPGGYSREELHAMYRRVEYQLVE
jgi:outer membrane protein OmpA-like peptidoglycan-associated protein